MLLAVIYAFVRRLVIRPRGIEPSRDALVILVFTGTLMVSIFLMNAFSILGYDYWFKDSMPISMAIAGWLDEIGLSADANRALGLTFKWVHMLIVLGFLVYIPTSKHLHIVAAAPNTFLRTNPPRPTSPTCVNLATIRLSVEF